MRGREERVLEFLSRYGEALGSGDVDTIARCWEVPALVLTDEGARAVGAEAEIETFFRGAVAWYRAQGGVAAEARAIESEPIGDRLLSVDVTWAALDARGVVTATEHSLYILRLDDRGDPRIRVAITTGRAEAPPS
jgi:hypothetical protein